MNESVAAQMLKRGMRLRAWAISRGVEKHLTLLKFLSVGKTQGRYGKSKELRIALEQEGFYIPKKTIGVGQ
ncbi:hypothetical protein LS73_004820, partial [Helicobacter muridarum]|uniref:Uncharacterized protein n=1 Tax=Helicobacter muridarum TaxID=216 RepID=A0A099TYN4_9HELI